MEPGHIDHDDLEAITVERGKVPDTIHQSRYAEGARPEFHTIEATHIKSGAVITGIHRSGHDKKQVWFNPLKQRWERQPSPQSAQQ